MKRRHLLAATLAVGLPSAWADQAELRAAILAFTGGIEPQPGRVAIEIEPLIENGNAVPVMLSVDGVGIQRLALFSELNPLREVVQFEFGPGALPRASTRIRLATSQQLVAVARAADGRCWQASVEVLVTLAACIEG
ncbi:thiosulfate oxidation carrier protein SoxY [Pelomonas sp. SE-A7]|uniref:thiosulfate oxidation carrier protein SoxY n=1 Tax=Pelomonas sp. SE-A7 TaxID=3054953 RepID=UPI00259D0D80|nr:thiosulfate oxidation carrier protein SoxY [Pelomonas sp. SE-A7]MDM4767817.1 thiosulfate oxidation carrier protein SoxY [Pelomonas sp. SE-A7]